MFNRLQKKYLILPLFYAFSANANLCQDDLVATNVEMVNPRTKEVMKFDCLNETRREFIKIIDGQDVTKKLVATAFKSLDEVSGEEKLTLNTVNIFENEIAVYVEKFDQAGKLERLERYKNQKIIFKYIEKAQRLEEFELVENEESRIIRECYFDIEDNKIKENIFNKIPMSIQLSMIDADEENIITSEEIIIDKGKNKLDIINKNNRVFLIDRFNIESCISYNFFPQTIHGEVGFLNKTYVLSEVGIVKKDLLQLVKEKKKEAIISLLESNSKEVKEREFEPETIPSPEVEPPVSPIPEVPQGDNSGDQPEENGTEVQPATGNNGNNTSSNTESNNSTDATNNNGASTSSSESNN